MTGLLFARDDPAPMTEVGLRGEANGGAYQMTVGGRAKAVELLE
jgi:hypothetical protein